jgi:hypothetical protein
MVCEIIVSMKDEEKKLSQNFLIYDDFCPNDKDPIILKCVSDTLDLFKTQPEKITVKIKLDIL